ncbi:MAG: hypothetical protein M1820_009286 [Bogoriella megaspora]|nr:MAG: hypothetical protein M1820_009286 [Bogoriella megaspora]
MQKVLGRSQQAAKQAARRARARTDKTVYELKKQRRRQSVDWNRKQSELFKSARKRLKEDWELGPLAPKRDVGEMEEKWCTIHAALLHQPPSGKKTGAAMERMNIRAGDRVVMLAGRDRGKIGTVNSISTGNASLTVKDLNMREVFLQEWMREEDGFPQAVHGYPADVPMKHVRLIHEYRDPDTGLSRDIIVEEIKTMPVRNRMPDEPRYERYIEGLPASELEDSTTKIDEETGKKVEVPPFPWEKIPWPEKTGYQHEDHPDDTLRITVEAKTFIPTLHGPPMPPNVLDELRNRYSKFRTRHTSEYIARKEAEGSEEEARKVIPDWMIQPSKALREQAKNRKKPATRIDIMEDEGFLERLGQMMSEGRPPAKRLAHNA